MKLLRHPEKPELNQLPQVIDVIGSTIVRDEHEDYRRQGVLLPLADDFVGLNTETGEGKAIIMYQNADNEEITLAWRFFSIITDKKSIGFWDGGPKQSTLPLEVHSGLGRLAVAFPESDTDEPLTKTFVVGLQPERAASLEPMTFYFMKLAAGSPGPLIVSRFFEQPDMPLNDLPTMHKLPASLQSEYEA